MDSRAMPSEPFHEIPDYVAKYLVELALSRLPDEVVEVLVSLSPEQIEGLQRIGRAFDEAECEPHLITFAIH